MHLCSPKMSIKLEKPVTYKRLRILFGLSFSITLIFMLKRHRDILFAEKFYALKAIGKNTAKIALSVLKWRLIGPAMGVKIPVEGLLHRFNWLCTDSGLSR